VRSDVVEGRVFRAVVVTAILVLLTACARPQGVVAIPTLPPSPTPVHHDPLIISNPVFHSGEVGVAYTPVTLSATGGVAPYTWTVPVGSLPGGLTLSPDGVVSGTPTANGNFAFSVQVLDTGGNDTAGVSANIPIVPRLTASLVSSCATECTVELGCVTVCGAFGQVSGGAAPLKYTLTSGPLPAGTTLNGLSLNGTFIGLPGRLQFTVQVTDGFGASALITARYNLLTHISLGSGPACFTTYYATGCKTSLPYSGGSGAVSVRAGSATGTLCEYRPTYSCGPTSTPPPGFAASASGGIVAITALPAGNNPFTFSGTVNLVLADGNPCGSGSNCSAGGPVTVTIEGG
jgi:large repetitive protein